jgi:signal transduction histidine kinase
LASLRAGLVAFRRGARRPGYGTATLGSGTSRQRRPDACCNWYEFRHGTGGSPQTEFPAAKAVAQNAELLEQIIMEIRTMSHLLHPPMLDEAGLALALQWYIEGFAERSKIKIELEMPSDFHRLTTENEIAIFRIIQECLTNIHRHSGSATAVVRIQEISDQLIVQVEDHGKGIPQEKQRQLTQSGRTGVGFAGMRERLRQLGGCLEIESLGKGTLVRAILKLPERAQIALS